MIVGVGSLLEEEIYSPRLIFEGYEMTRKNYM